MPLFSVDQIELTCGSGGRVLILDLVPEALEQLTHPARRHPIPTRPVVLFAAVELGGNLKFLERQLVLSVFRTTKRSWKDLPTAFPRQGKRSMPKRNWLVCQCFSRPSRRSNNSPDRGLATKCGMPISEREKYQSRTEILVIWSTYRPPQARTGRAIEWPRLRCEQGRADHLGARSDVQSSLAG